MMDAKNEIDDILKDIQKTEESISLSLSRTLLSEPLSIDNKFAQLCLKLPKSEFNELNINDVYIVWLRNKNETKSELLNGIDIKMFYTNDELIDFISEIQTNNIFLIIDQYFASNILLFLDDFSQILFIYILTNEDLLFIDSKRSIHKISNNKTELFRSIEEDIDIFTKDYFSTSIFDLHTEEKSKNLSFLWYHLLINSLFDLPTYNKTAKEDFVKYCREQYSINDIITEFDNEYLSTDAIRWYTPDSFIYRLLNKALRTRDIDLIFKFRFFIIDFQNQLNEHYNKNILQSFQVAYRNQQLSSLQFDKLKTSIGKYISINTYLSATIDRNMSDSHPSSVLFVIHTENAIHKKSQRVRPVYIHDKIYFPIGSTFLIDSIEMKNNQWYIKLILSDNENYENLFNFISKLPSSIQFADLLVSIGEYEKAERYLQILIKDLKISDENIIKGYAYNYMGQISIEKGDYNCALSWYKHALDFIPIENVYRAKIYLAVGSLHCDKQEYSNALEYFHKALNYEKEMEFLTKIQLHQEFSRTYTLMNQFDEAIVYLNQALCLCRSNQLNYHSYISIYVSLALLYEKKLNYHEAIRLLKEELHSELNIISKSHQYLNFIYTLIGYMYYKCQDYTSAMIYCEKALQLKETINPFQYIFLCSIFVELYKQNDDMKNRFYYAQEAYHTYKDFITKIPQTSPIVWVIHINMSVAYYFLRDLTSALDFLFKAFEFIDEVHDKISLFIYIAIIYIDKSDIKMGLNYLGKSFQLISNTDESIDNKNSLAQLNFEYSRIYKLKNNHKKAIIYAEESLRLNEENRNDTQIFTCCTLLSELRPDKEKKYIKKLLDILQEHDLSNQDKQKYHTYIGLHYKKSNDFPNALYHFQSSLKYELLNNPPCYYQLILIYIYIADVYNEIEPKDFDLILFYYEKCVEVYVELLNMNDIPEKDKQKMLIFEGYILDNIKQSSLLNLKIIFIYYLIGNIYQDKRNPIKALNYFQNAEQILNEYKGKKQDILYKLIGSAYESLHYYNQAIICYKKGLENISNDYNKFGYYYHLLGDIYRDKKDYILSISTYKISLTFLHNSQSVNYKYLAACYNKAALLYVAINNYEYAFIYSKQAIHYHLLCEPVNYDSIIAIYKFGAIFLWKSKPWNFKEPLDYLLPAIDYNQYSLKHSSLENLYSTIGFFYILNQMYDKALLLYNKSLKYSITSNEFSRNYEKIWLIYMFIGDLDKAYDIIKNSIGHQFKSKILDFDHISRSHINIGITYYQFGKYELALECYQTAFYLLQAFQNDKTHGNYGNIYNYIGLIYFKYGNISNALKYCLKSRDILSLNKNQDFLPIYPYISLGLIECKLGNYYKSLDYLGQAWELIYNNNRYYNLAYKTLYNHIGFVYYKLGQKEIAMKFYSKSLLIHHEYNEHSDLAQIHKNIGLIYEENPENYSLALISYKRALELVPINEHPDHILYKSMIITLKLKIKKEKRRKRKLRMKRTCKLL